MKTINLTQDKFAMVDDDLFNELNKYRWFAQKIGNTFYAVRKSSKRVNGWQKTYYMHSEVFRLTAR